MNRRFVNLVTRNWAEDFYSLRRIDPYKHFFYGSAKAAQEASDEEAKDSFPVMQNLELPSPSMNFTAASTRCTLDMFALFSTSATREGRMLYANSIGEAGLYDADKHVHNTMGRLNAPKGYKPVCLPIARPGADDDSMYILDRCPGNVGGRCFEVLEPMPRRKELGNLMPPWRWRLLPPPPFIHQPGYEPSSITSFATIVDCNGCSTIYVSCDGGIGTYSFVTARPDSRALSEEWSHVGKWKLPFSGRAQYVPEFNLWFGFSPFRPNHLCAVDLSDMDYEQPPTARRVWQDLNPPEGETWFPIHLKLLNLGNGKFLTAKTFEAEATSGQFALLTGIEMMAGVGDDQGPQMVKHKCARFFFKDDTVEWVL